MDYMIYGVILAGIALAVWFVHWVSSYGDVIDDVFIIEGED